MQSAPGACTLEISHKSEFKIIGLLHKIYKWIDANPLDFFSKNL